MHFRAVNILLLLLGACFNINAGSRYAGIEATGGGFPGITMEKPTFLSIKSVKRPSGAVGLIQYDTEPVAFNSSILGAATLFNHDLKIGAGDPFKYRRIVPESRAINALMVRMLPDEPTLGSFFPVDRDLGLSSEEEGNVIGSPPPEVILHPHPLVPFLNLRVLITDKDPQIMAPRRQLPASAPGLVPIFESTPPLQHQEYMY